jgi:hypothetical protein
MGNVGSGLGYCDLVSSIKKLADFPGETFRKNWCQATVIRYYDILN